MKLWHIISFPTIVLVLLTAGCGSDTSTKPDVLNTFKGTLSLVVIADSDGSPAGVEHVPVVVTILTTAEPGPYRLDTVYTNAYGVAYFMRTVGCARYDSRGRLAISVGDAEPFDVFFADGEDISRIIDYDALGSNSR